MYHRSIPEAINDKSLPEYSFHITTKDLLDVDTVMELAYIYSASKVVDKVRKYWLSINNAPVRAYSEEELLQLTTWVIPMLSTAA
ncbi:MAG: hypothetical protein COX82_01600 [Candidatus Magasanikbacteria bacterium CG_4_10_14_0_2_um_filter_41_10]|uniref:Uncharacterized protein n=1 Tax=Candidatus Magasanikbacteria bacterium CG_4_10_14_0_2_um_filter_41_10 TaxID=1974638 RepID=A0A2M7V5S9_9BACT|nr:MAG: hypothetical protein COX82_01600 [Candidatus Magasanikbacteria bacterium CG_4_10_14_0_2_um_filter_41_10]